MAVDWRVEYAGAMLPHREGISLAIRLQPNASRNAVVGVVDGVLKVMVTAIPEDGKANAALVKLLSKEWKIPKAALLFLAGEANRNKVLLIKV